MSKKLLVVFTAIMMGLFAASIAAAAPIAYADPEDTPGESIAILHHFAPGGNLADNTAGTILNPEGKGDVLIFPYYDVREINGKTQDFLFAIVNKEWVYCEDIANASTGNACWDGVAAKLRFREWDKSEEVFDVDIWMSRGDVWVGSVSHNQALPFPWGARITSPDYVIINNDANTLTLDTPLKNGYDFPTIAFIPGPTNPPYTVLPLVPTSPGSSNLYGYVEVIGEERTYDHIWTFSPSIKVTRVTFSGDGSQVRFGGPADCTIFPYCVSDVPNELVGMAYIQRVADGQSHAYNAKAFANFNDVSPASATSLFYGPGNQFPTLENDAEDYLESLEFQMAKEEIWGIYDVEAGIAAQYSLIVTFPTKHFHFCQKPNYTASSAVTAPLNCDAPYPTPPWTSNDINVGDHHANTPEIYFIDIWDRNENRLSPPPCYVSPCQGNPIGFPYEVNILGFYQGGTPGIPGPAANVPHRNNLVISTGTFDSGWFEIELNDGTGAGVFNLIDFLNMGTLYTGYSGLPGFALQLQEFSNNAVGGWYGAILDAFYSWEPLGRIFPVAP